MTQKPNNEILIIEDDDLFFCSLRNRLEDRGVSVTRAKNGDEGIKICKRKQFPLIVTDVVMPRINGFEFIKTIKEQQTHTPKIIVISNMGSSKLLQDKNFTETLGINKYLVKSKSSVTDITNQIIECLN